MKQDAINQYKTATDNFLTMLGNFNTQQFNAIPFEDSWTPAQVADHMLKSQVGLPDVFKGTTEPANRKPDEAFGMIEGVFLDFNTKLKSPDFILPTTAPQDLADLTNRYQTTSRQVQETYARQEPTEICLDFSIPGSGPFTRMEWLHFVTCHTIRHTRQLENIHQQLKQ